MTKKEKSIPKLVKDSDNDQERDYILQDNKKTKFGATFIIVVLVILVLAVVATSYFIGG
jgi:flagellar basal body-associated protein FliL